MPQCFDCGGLTVGDVISALNRVRFSVHIENTSHPLSCLELFCVCECHYRITRGQVVWGGSGTAFFNAWEQQYGNPDVACGADDTRREPDDDRAACSPARSEPRGRCRPGGCLLLYPRADAAAQQPPTADHVAVSLANQDPEMQALQLMWVDVLQDLSAASCPPDARVAANAALAAVSSYLGCAARALRLTNDANGRRVAGQVAGRTEADRTYRLLGARRCALAGASALLSPWHAIPSF